MPTGLGTLPEDFKSRGGKTTVMACDPWECHVYPQEIAGLIKALLRDHRCMVNKPLIRPYQVEICPQDVKPKPPEGLRIHGLCWKFDVPLEGFGSIFGLPPTKDSSHK